MPRQLDWSLSFPIQDGILPDDTLIVKSRGTSGAGQFEVAGAAKGPSGQTIRARDVVGKQITFVLPAPVGDAYIRLAMSYPVQEVGGKVRVSVKSDSVTRPNVGNLFAAAFMLPDVSSREQSLPFDESDLGEKTYWIDDVSCRVFAVNDDIIVLEPEEFILASRNKNDTAQFSAMAIFDFRSRLELLYKACARGANSACGSAKFAFIYYRDCLIGEIPFDCGMASFMKSYIMTWLEEKSTGYKRDDDPLPTLSAMIPDGEDGIPTRRNSDKPRNWIFFGAPGTGKSHELNEIAKETFDDGHRARVTFYPDYTYSQFVGCFKPITKYRNDADDPASRAESYISYEFVPGPFLETYVKAVQNPKENFLLVVEEINRANPAAVFGDVFQLLDRDDGGRSVYEVAAPKEMRDYLRVFLSEYATNAHIAGPLELLYEQGRLENEANRLSLPGNMYIWATMNSADQGVFPMDTAFKRRWSFRYMGINEGENANIGGQALSEITVPCGGRDVVWNNLRRAINEFMASDGLRINEDKLLGPFFISPADLTPERFASTFKDKVLLYLYEDAGKTKRSKMFKKELNTYSKVCDAFDEIGEGIFGEGFDGSGLVNEVIEADLAEE